MSHARPISDAARALANVGESVRTLMNIADTLEVDRRLVVQQVAWAIQDELETISRYLKEETEAEASNDHQSSSNIARLIIPKPRDENSDT